MVRQAGFGARYLHYWREVHDPRARIESCADQTAYRAEIDAYYARNPGMERTVQAFPCCGALKNTSHEVGCPNRYATNATVKEST